MISRRQFLTVVALCGMVALGSFNIGDIATSIGGRDATPSTISPSAEAEVFDASPVTVTGSIGETASSASFSAAEVPSVEIETTALSAPPEEPQEKPARLVSAFPSKVESDEPLPPVRPLEISSECLTSETCIDEYLWALYERTPKVDTNKVVTRTKKSVKKNGKVRTILATITNYVMGDFTWKDPAAAEKVGMPLKDYVIGGMDPGFKLKLFRALRTLDAAGFMPGITSAFRDDYRQSIANGNKAASDSSYHGGSRRGGFGRGLAADLVSVKGDTRIQRLTSSDEMWKWIDTHEQELGIGRPYRDRDPPHVGPLDGKEYADKRSAALKAAEKAKTAKPARTETKKHGRIARHDPVTAKHARPEKPAKVSSLQTSLALER